MRRVARGEPAFAAFSFAALIAVAAAPRLVGLACGLPHVYNADEPHVVNMAVSLSGSLRPYSFKYPTLWPELLAACYGVWFVFWSGFGLARGVVDFAARYAFAPTGFYLIARGLSTAAQLAGLAALAHVERREKPERWAYGSAALAFSPSLVELAHAAKPDSLMFLLVIGAVAAALRHQKDGRRIWLRLSAFLAGLACSTQYTAAPACLIVPLAWLLCAKGPGPFSWLIEAGFLSALGFTLGTPFAFIDHVRFVADWSDYADLGRLKAHDAAATARLVAANVWSFGGAGSPAGLAAIIGCGSLLRRDPRRTLLLAAPIAAYAALLSASFDGGVPRYLLGAYPMLALFAGEGISVLSGRRRWLGMLLGAALIAPGAVLCWSSDAELLLPDTRAQATQWLASNIPAGAALLLDQPHSGPLAVMSLAQCQELAERLTRAGSPRASLFRAMAARHPGGGYRIVRIQRAAADLWSSPHHVAQSQADGDFLDVRPGLDVVRAARIDYVFTSSAGADPRRARELATFFTELSAQAELVKEFPAEPGIATGPWLRVYRLRR